MIGCDAIAVDAARAQDYTCERMETAMTEIDAPAEAPRHGATLTRVALAGGVALLGLAAVLLWASQGAGVFLESAFAALIACF